MHPRIWVLTTALPKTESTLIFALTEPHTSGVLQETEFELDGLVPQLGLDLPTNAVNNPDESDTTSTLLHW
jgi:hypothetical protein